MRLFDVIPENLFSILASRNKEIYLDALFVLRRAYKQELIITKDHLITMLIADLEDKLMELELDEDEMAPEKNLSSVAHFLLRKLFQAKWIDIEYSSDSFEEHVTLYDYSIKILNTLYDLINTAPREYNSYVYSTYSALKTANEERNGYTFNALTEAYKNTNSLVDELKSLLNNIRRYHQSLNAQEEIKAILYGHFDQFKELVGDKIYHPLKTFDSIPRFKTPILNILKSWLFDAELKDLMAESAIMRKNYADQEEALDNIILMIGDIIDVYEKIDELIKEIDRKNAAYTRASVEKMQYLLNTDKSIKGKLVEMLKTLGTGADKKKDKLHEAMQSSINLYQQGFIDENSLYTRAERKVREQGQPLKISNLLENDALLVELEDFKDRVKRSYTAKRIKDFMYEQFGGKLELEAEELGLQMDDDFILLILGILKHDEKSSFYNVDFQDGYILLNGYRIPRMKLAKKV